jgi:predicted amidohydrolase YtcJ
MKQFLFVLLSVTFLTSCVGHETEFARSLRAPSFADLVLVNGKIVTLDSDSSVKEAIAVKAGLIVAVGTDGEMRKWRGPETREINLGGRTVIPGLIDAHIHATAAGINWDSELHWENLRTLAAGLKQIAAGAKQKPASDWIVVGGGWTPMQFAERRLPSRADLDAAAPNNPVFVQVLDRGGLLNSAALRTLGVNRETRDPPGGHFERYAETDEPTGLVVGHGAWKYVHERISRPPFDKARQSLRNCFRELNRLGLTSVGDFHSDEVTFAHRRLLESMSSTGQLTLRVNFHVAPSESGDMLEQFNRALAEIKQLNQSDLFQFAGFGEVLARDAGDGDVGSHSTISVAAKEQFRRAVEFFAKGGLHFQLRPARDATARQLLDVIEAVHRQTPLARSRIAFAHLEDAAPETVERIKKIGGGILVSSRSQFTVERGLELGNGHKIRNPALRTLLDTGIPLGAGSDAFRSGNYSPMLMLWWLVTGKSTAGVPVRDPKQNLTRLEALRVHTLGSAWFVGDERRKGSIEIGKLADFAVLNEDYLSVPEERIPRLESLLTMVGGRVVYAAGPFARSQQP